MSLTKTIQHQYTSKDREFFLERGIDISEVTRQRALLTNPEPCRTHADRACTVGDGVLQVELGAREGYMAKGREAVRMGRLTDFVPASGAATRMFADLIDARNKGADFLYAVPDTAEVDKLSGAVLKVFQQLPTFAFYAELCDAVSEMSGGSVDVRSSSAEELLRNHHGGLVISAIIDAAGLGLASKPKALIPFHRYTQSDVRTSLAEHLHSAVEVGADEMGICRVHFTCSPEHMADFQVEAEWVAQRLQREKGVTFELSFSIQDPSTDTICVDTRGNLVRGENEQPLLRPGGHGALLFNLNELGQKGADVVYINNIDNVHPEKHRREFTESKLLLLGVLTETQKIMHASLQALRSGMTIGGVESLYQELSRQIGLGIPDALWHGTREVDRADLLIAALNRPVRVVGVVKNTGEPGGGPFWVQGTDGRVTRQVVEKHELDPANPDQLALFNQGTHFNPVRLMCGLRDANGQAHNLLDFVNQDAVLISEKSVSGSKVKILERPGLWNGSMAEWTTVFVEVDEATFAPVKSVADLARPAHQC